MAASIDAGTNKRPIDPGAVSAPHIDSDGPGPGPRGGGGGSQGQRIDAQAAEGQFKQAIALLEDNYPGSPALVSAQAELAGFLARNGRESEALVLLI